MNHRRRSIPLSALAMCIAGALTLGQAQAQGLGHQPRESSVEAMGRAFAGSGVATGDAAVVVNNPAAMTAFEGTTLQVGLTLVDHDATFDGGGLAGTGRPFVRPVTGGNGGGDGDADSIPAFSLVHRFDNGFALGAMVGTPFGARTEYDAGWVGRFEALDSNFRFEDMTVSAAYDVVPGRFSVGAGVVYERAEVELSHAVDFGSQLAFLSVPGFLPLSADGQAAFSGDDTSLGWIVGIHLTPTEHWAIGLSHRSGIDHDLQGSADWTVPGNVRTVFNGIGRSALFNDGEAGSQLSTPSVTTLSLSYRVNDALSLFADYTRTGWDSLDEIRIDFENPDPDAVEALGWDDTSFWSLGAEYALSGTLTLRGGFAQDETPTSLANRSPRLPGADSRWYSIGLGWSVGKQVEFSAAYTRIDMDTAALAIVDAANNSTLAGEFRGDANLFGVSGRFSF